MTLSLFAFMLMLLVGCGSIEDTESGFPLGDGIQLTSSHPSQTEARCINGSQSRGALYEICLPEADQFNGTLILYVHGFIFPQAPLHIPAVEGGVQVSEFILSRGFGYAATSLYKNGIVDPNKGIEDIVELVHIYHQQFGPTDRVLLLSFSNGAFLSTLAMEKNPDLFDGALASCGPVGSYRAAVDYLTDVAVLFNLFFGDVEIVPGAGPGIPGSPEGVPPAFLAQLEASAPPGFTAVDVLLQALVTALSNHPEKTEQLLGTLQLTSSISRNTVLFAAIPEAVELVVGAVAYNVFITNDGLQTFGGRYFDNRDRLYGDLLPDESIRAFINAAVPRYAADRNVSAQLDSRYESKGKLRRPVVALHNVRDPRVPIWQESLYLDDLGPRAVNYHLQVIDRQGHCNFTEDEVNDGLDLLMSEVGNALAAF